MKKTRMDALEKHWKIIPLNLLPSIDASLNSGALWSLKNLFLNSEDLAKLKDRITPQRVCWKVIYIGLPSHCTFLPRSSRLPPKVGAPCVPVLGVLPADSRCVAQPLPPPLWRCGTPRGHTLSLKSGEKQTKVIGNLRGPPLPNATPCPRK